jgi:16S rRNA (cytosine967-C5)-methyltransferase
MTPAARLQAVLDLLEKIDASRIPMDGTVGDYMRNRRYIGGKDRAAVAERLYMIVRAHARLDWWLARAKADDTPRNRALAWLSLGEGMEPKYVEQLFDASTYGPTELNPDEHALLPHFKSLALDHPDMPDSVRAECPPAWEEKLRAQFGDAFEAEMKAMIPPATLDLRVNLRKIGREDAAKSLAKDKVETVLTRLSPWGLRAKSKAFLSETKAFTKGLVEIQDEGSQLIALVGDPQPGMQVLDYCAGSGGKTLALAAAMNNKGRIVACDIEENRLAKIRPRLKRSGVADIVEVRPLSDEKNRKWLRRQKGTFDLVLVDAPCSGTGTWRRNPDLRWRQFGPSLEQLIVTQAEILDRVAKTVKPGGKLVYATCSLVREENEAQVEAFLQREPDFTVLPMAQAWPGGSPPCDGDFMRLTPLRHETDGFFAAVLVRTATAEDVKEGDTVVEFAPRPK